MTDPPAHPVSLPSDQTKIPRPAGCLCDDVYGDNPFCPAHEYEDDWLPPEPTR